MSPRAAARLATLGFARVHDYVAGKADWGSYGLPLDGREGSPTRAGAHARADVPVCTVGDGLVEVAERVAASGWDTCFVLDDDGVVLGRLGRDALRRTDAVRVEEAMTPGPSTVRAGARLDAMLERMRRQNLADLPVTRSDGRLVGLLLRGDVERAVAGQAAAAG